MKKLKKISRNELKTINGSKLLPGGGGFGCTDACQPGDGRCEQYGLTCGLWIHTAPGDGTVNYACNKCA